MLAELRGCVDTWIAATTEGPRGLDGIGLARRASTVDLDLHPGGAGRRGDALRAQSRPRRRSHRRLRLVPHRRTRARRARTRGRRRRTRMTIIRAMDRPLKARLIGASVLVLVVVLVVPELLSGRKAATTETPGAADTTSNMARRARTPSSSARPDRRRRPMRTCRARYTPESSPLAAERPARAQASPSDRDDTAAARPPVASTAAREAAAPRETKPATAGSERGSDRTDTVAGTASAPAERRTTGGIRQRRARARHVVRAGWRVRVGRRRRGSSSTELEADGFAAYVAPVARNGKTLHRVRVGPESATRGGGRTRRRASRRAGCRSRSLPTTEVMRRRPLRTVGCRAS